MMDTMAHGAYPVFDKMGVRIPDDIEIVAYNDSAINRFLRPSLTVVDLPVQRLVRASIRLLLEMISGRHPEPVTRYEETFFVYRETCGGFPES
jgi:LacI family transcriptional regulator